MNQNDTLVELRDIFANVLANASFSVLQDLTTCELFRATRFPETTSRFAPYEFFPLHQGIFSSEGRVWNLFG